MKGRQYFETMWILYEIEFLKFFLPSKNFGFNLIYLIILFFVLFALQILTD